MVVGVCCWLLVLLGVFWCVVGVVLFGLCLFVFCLLFGGCLGFCFFFGWLCCLLLIGFFLAFWVCGILGFWYVGFFLEFGFL